MDIPIVILYTKAEWLEATQNSIRALGMTNPFINIRGTFDKPLKRYQIVSYIWRNTILPLVEGKEFYYTEEGPLWKSIPPKVNFSMWFGYTKRYKERLVGTKCVYFTKEDSYKIKGTINKYFHIDYLFSNTDYIMWEEKGVFSFKLLPRKSYFNTKHPKNLYEI